MRVCECLGWQGRGTDVATHPHKRRAHNPYSQRTSRAAVMLSFSTFSRFALMRRFFFINSFFLRSDTSCLRFTCFAADFFAVLNSSSSLRVNTCLRAHAMNSAAWWCGGVVVWWAHKWLNEHGTWCGVALWPSQRCRTSRRDVAVTVDVRCAEGACCHASEVGVRWYSRQQAHLDACDAHDFKELDHLILSQRAHPRATPREDNTGAVEGM